MFLSADVISLVLYCAQQLGVTLGVGSQTILLVAYLMAMRDGVIDPKEAQFVRAVRYVLIAGLVLIVSSGVGITALHLVAGQAATIFSEAYLFKWVLIIGTIIFTLVNDISPKIAYGLAGGSWYALFIVHILAPVATWVNLLTLYLVWMVGFLMCWIIAVYGTKERKAVAPKEVPPERPAPAIKSITAGPAYHKTPAPAPAPVKTEVPKPPPSPPPVPPAPKPEPPKVSAPVNSPKVEQKHIVQTLPQPTLPSEQTLPVKKPENPWLPAIKIMPKENNQN